MSDVNPHKQDTPEWQLWENMRSKEMQAVAFSRDAERYTKMSQEARESAEKYRKALERLA